MRLLNVDFSRFSVDIFPTISSLHKRQRENVLIESNLNFHFHAIAFPSYQRNPSHVRIDKLCFYLTSNRFDILVNGGGAITLQFQRAPFRPQTRTIFVPWNQIIVLPPVQMKLVDESESKMPKIHANIAYSFLNALQYNFHDGSANDTNVAVTNVAICPVHDHEQLRPILTSTWMPNAVGSMAGRSAVFAENQVSLFTV